MKLVRLSEVIQIRTVRRKQGKPTLLFAVRIFLLGEDRDVVFIVWYELIAGGNPKELPLQGYRGEKY